MLHKGFTRLQPKTATTGDAIFITDCTLSIDRAEVAADKYAQINSLLETAANNCAENNITRNSDGHIIALTLATSQLVTELRTKLIGVFELPSNAQTFYFN
jgi:hypothetical protein